MSSSTRWTSPSTTKGVVFVADHEAHALFKVTDAGLEVVAKGEGRPRTPLYGIRHIAATFRREASSRAIRQR